MLNVFFQIDEGISMKRMLLCLVLLLLCPYMLCAGKDDAMMDKARELSYEGQLQTAKKLMEGEAESGREPARDSSWDDTVMMLGMLWGALGTGYFIYGKKTSKAAFLLCGIGLVVLPMFVSSAMYNALIGIALSVIPFKVEI